MAAALRRDYTAMPGMIFGTPPNFSDILKPIDEFEHQLNAQKK
jgi:hypothetical protein